MEDKQIATITKNTREDIRVMLREFKGHKLADLRVWATSADGDKIATSKGIGFKVTLLPELIAALRDAEAEARALGLFDAAPADHAD